MRIFPNDSVGVAQFGYILFGFGIVSWIIDSAWSGPSSFPIHLGFGSIALTGLVAISAAKQLKNLEDRLDEIEKVVRRHDPHLGESPGGPLPLSL